MNHQRSGWSSVAESTPALTEGNRASRTPLLRMMRNYRRKMRKVEQLLKILDSAIGHIVMLPPG